MDEQERGLDARMQYDQRRNALAGAPRQAGQPFPDTPSVNPPVKDRLSELGQAIEFAHARLAHLIDRLEPALRPRMDAPKAASEKMPPRAVESPIAEVLRGYGLGVQVLIDQLNQTIDRVDV